jgi:hypothetical protein
MYSSEKDSRRTRARAAPDPTVSSGGAHEVGDPCRLLPVRTREPNRDAVDVLVEADEFTPRSTGRLDVLGSATNPNGTSDGTQVSRLDEHELAPHRHCSIQHVSQQAETLPLPHL